MSLAAKAIPVPTVAHRACRMAAVVATIVAVIFISVMPQVGNDFWLQAKVGELIVHNRAIPATLLFPYTEIQSAKFNAHEWLPSVLFHYLIVAVGEAGLPLIAGAGGFLLFASAAALAYRRGAQSLPLALLAGLVAVGVENFRHTLRPELIALLLLTLYWHGLESLRLRRSPWALSAILLTVIVWANSHGSFVLAPVIAGIYALGTWLDGRRTTVTPHFGSATTPGQFVMLTLAVLACTLVTPFGWELLRFALEFGNSRYINEHVIEWYSVFDPRLRGQRGLWIGAGCALVLATVAVIQHRRLSAVDALILLLFFLLALRAVRFLTYLGLAFAYIAPPLLAHWWKQRDTTVTPSLLVTMAGATVLGLSMVYGNAMGGYPHHVSWDPSFSRPMRDVISDPRLKGNVLNDYDYGAELVYRAYPRLKPSIDSRIDSYGPEYFFYHRRLVHEEALFSEFVQRYDVRYVLMSHHNFQSFRTLPSYTSGRWVVHAMDRKVVLLRPADLHSSPQQH
jgi:hypothetical protein